MEDVDSVFVPQFVKSVVVRGTHDNDIFKMIFYFFEKSNKRNELQPQRMATVTESSTLTLDAKLTSVKDKCIPKDYSFYLVRRIDPEFGDLEVHIAVDEKKRDKFIQQMNTLVKDDPDSRVVVSLVKNSTIVDSVVNETNDLTDEKWNRLLLAMTSSLSEQASSLKSPPVTSSSSETASTAQENDLQFPIGIRKFFNYLTDENPIRYSTLYLQTISSLYYDDYNYHSRDEIFDDN